MTFIGTADEAHAQAARSAGLEDFGDQSYREGLETLLRAITTECTLDQRGQEKVWADIVQILVARLHSVHHMTDDDRADTISAPIVITGVPRTGTTALHKLMAVDPQFQGLNRWVTNYPMPRPPRQTWDDDPRFLATAAAIKARYDAAPDYRKMHLEAADEVDECMQVLRQGFVSIRFGTRVRVPSYDQWIKDQSDLPTYEWFGRVTAMIGRHDRRRWLLKNPSHILALPALLAVFPDAVFIQTHRTLQSAIPSFCSIVEQLRVEQGSPVTDTAEIGRRELGIWGPGALEAFRYRAQVPNLFVDVNHAEFNRAPLDTIASIYNLLDLELRDEVGERMRQRVAADPERQHGTHRYDMATFGLTLETVRSAFGEYATHFDI